MVPRQKPIAKSQKCLSLFFSLFLLLLCVPAIVYAQWEPDVKLSTTDSSAHTNENMARCLVACGDTLHAVWYDSQNRGSAVFYKCSSDRGTTWVT